MKKPKKKHETIKQTKPKPEHEETSRRVSETKQKPE